MSKLLLRRGEVMEALGVSKEKVKQMVECKVLCEVYLGKDSRGKPTGQARFRRLDVERIAGKF